MRAALRSLAFPIWFAAAPSGLAAQVPRAPGDSVPVALPPLIVNVRRSEEALARIPAAVSVIDSTGFGRGRTGLGPDEVLWGVPGVYVANRYNYSLDQRISIRGFGSRANFGVRGVRVLLDGIPQTLPDGQTQLTNVDWSALERIEVLRGPAGAFYGNGSGGVIALESARAGSEPWAAAASLHAGAFGLVRWRTQDEVRSGRFAGVLSAGGFSLDGFRQHSEARTIQLSLRTDYHLSPAGLLTLHLAHADAPRADNPGALTAAELEARRDSAAANNILRAAGKDVRQSQLGVSLRHAGGATQYTLAAFGLIRRLDNPLATGTYVDIGRAGGGFRAAGEHSDTAAGMPVRVTAGVELQHLRDDRRNRLADGGEPTDSVQLDQREKVTERGVFAQLALQPSPRWTVSAGVRRDAVTFTVADRHLADGADNSGRRTMSAWSGNAGVSLLTAAVTPYVNLATAFETPTTTELANSPDGSGGFNAELGPQRSVSFEVGARGARARISWSAAAFVGRVSDGIVQFQEVGGRAFFRNAGRLHQDGAELGLSGVPVPRLRVTAAYTYARHRFARYEVSADPGAAPLDGNQVPGVPAHFLRVAILAEPWTGATLDVEHALASALYADDANAIRVSGWGSGVTGVRLTWSFAAGGALLVPQAGINNLFDRKYIGSVTANGAFGRVFEPAPGRNAYAGLEVRFAGRASGTGAPL